MPASFFLLFILVYPGGGVIARLGDIVFPLVGVGLFPLVGVGDFLAVLLLLAVGSKSLDE